MEVWNQCLEKSSDKNNSISDIQIKLLMKNMPDEILKQNPDMCIKAMEINKDCINDIPQEVIDQKRDVFDPIFRKTYEEDGYTLANIPAGEIEAHPEKYSEAIIKENGITLLKYDEMYGFNKDFKANGNIKLLCKIEDWSGTDYNMEPTINEGETVHADKKLRVVYNTALSTETNKKLLDAYGFADKINFDPNAWFCIRDFIVDNINNLEQCLGGREKVKEFAEEWSNKDCVIEDSLDIEAIFEDIDENASKPEETTKDVELSAKMDESKKLDKQIKTAEELLENYKQQDPEKKGESIDDN